MALKVLELREAIDQKKQELSALREKEGSFSLRENELAVQIEQATEAEHADVEGMVDELNAEKEETKEKINTLSREIEEMEAELAAEEERHRAAGRPVSLAPRPERNFHEFIVRCEKHAEKRPRGPQPCGSDAFVPGVPRAYFLPHLSLAVRPPALFSGAHRQPVGPGLYRH